MPAGLFQPDKYRPDVEVARAEGEQVVLRIALDVEALDRVDCVHESLGGGKRSPGQFEVAGQPEVPEGCPRRRDRTAGTRAQHGRHSVVAAGPILKIEWLESVDVVRPVEDHGCALRRVAELV